MRAQDEKKPALENQDTMSHLHEEYVKRRAKEDRTLEQMKLDPQKTEKELRDKAVEGQTLDGPKS